MNLGVNVLPIFLGLLIAFCFGTSDYLSKDVARRIGGYRTAIWMLALSGIGVLFPAFFLPSELTVTPFFLVVLAITAALTFLAFNFMYRAYDAGALSLTSPVVNSYPVVSVIFSVFVLDIPLSSIALAALAVAIAGIILVSTKFSELRRAVNLTNPAPGIRYALLAAIFLGIAFPSFGYTSKNLGYLLPVISSRGAAAALGFALSRPLGQKVGSLKDIPWRRLLSMIVLESIGVATFSIGIIVSSYSGTIPVLSTLGGMSVAFTVGYAIILLRERIELNHIIGIIMVVLGIAALLYLTT